MGTRCGPIVIATLMREHGNTGVQTHVKFLREYLAENGTAAEFVNPFSGLWPLCLPIFAMRHLIGSFRTNVGVFWYLYWHCFFLRIALWKRLRRGKGVVIYAHCPFSARAALRSRRGPLQKVVMAVHYNQSLAEEWLARGSIRERGWVYRWIEWVEELVLRQLDGIVYVSEFARAHTDKVHPKATSVRSIVVPNFISEPLPLGDVEIRGDLINIGSLEPRKNQAYLLNVLAESKRRGRHFRLMLVGGGPDRRMLERLAERLELGNQVSFAGARRNAATMLPEYRMYVHSALRENLPITLIEALSQGRPVLAGAVGGIPEIITDGREGRFWLLDDPADGATKLIAILENSELYSQMSRNARERFETHFVSHVVAQRLVDFLCGFSVA